MGDITKLQPALICSYESVDRKKIDVPLKPVVSNICGIEKNSIDARIISGSVSRDTSGSTKIE